MVRRAALVMAAALVLTTIAVHSRLAHPSRPATVMLVYVGAADCAPCRIWARDHRPGFIESAEARQITYREVLSPRLLDLKSDEYWPEDLRGYRALLGSDAGVPLWIVFADGKLALEARGLSAWQTEALPRLRALLR